MQSQGLENSTLLPDSLVGRLYHYAAATPKQDAIVTPQLTLNYAELAKCVQSQTQQLKKIGVSAQSIVGIRCADDTGHLLLCLAISQIGATSCTIPSYESEQAQQAAVENCKATIVLDQQAIMELVSPDDTAIVEPYADDAGEACLLFSTSGTTGKPKLVVHHDTDIVAQAHRHISSPQERFTCRASMEHNFAKRHRLYCLAMGATNIFLSGELESVVADCIALQVNVMHLSSFQAQELLQLSDISRLASIRLKLGGSHVPNELRQQLKTDITSQLQAGYGTTETGAIAFTDPNDKEAGESVGRPLSGIEIRAVDNDRKPVGQGQKGELAIRCKGMFRGYQSRSELTAQRLQDDWFYTGDIGHIDKDQRIHLSGRSDDMFTFNSLNIYPQEIETEIRQFPGISDVLVLPKPSAIHGQIPVALVVFDHDIRPNLSALKKFVQKKVGLRSPRHYTIVDQIPTNASGKVSRIAASQVTEKADQVRSQLLELLDDKYTAHIKPSHITEFIEGKRDLSLRKLGLDSLARMDILVSLETQHDIVITPQELSRYRTLGKIASRLLILSKQGKQTHQPVASPAQLHIAPDELAGALPPHNIRFFQRLFKYCQTVAELNQIFAKIEHRLTPRDIAYLQHLHYNNALLPAETEQKYHTAITSWINEVVVLMQKSDRLDPEPFQWRKIASNIMLFTTPSSSSTKTLLIGFPPRGVRHMMMPTAVLLQHIDARLYDVLIIDEVDNSYGFGHFPFGRKLDKQAQWLQTQNWFRGYSHIRTLGFSAGSLPAIAFGYLLRADLALSIAGRFHKKKHPLINLDKILTSFRANRKGQCEHLLLSYSHNNRRDKQFARFFTKLYQGKEIAIEIKTEKLPHLMLRRLAERGELSTYLKHTLFVDTEHLKGSAKNSVISFPLVKQM